MGKRKLRSSVGAKSKNSIENAQAKKKEATAVEAAISEMKTYKKKTKIDDKVNFFFPLVYIVFLYANNKNSQIYCVNIGWFFYRSQLDTCEQHVSFSRHEYWKWRKLPFYTFIFK